MPRLKNKLGLGLSAISLVAFLSACAAGGLEKVETADEVKAREQMVIEATQDPDDRGVGDHPQYQSAEEREAIQHTVTLCIDTNDAALAALPADTVLADREVLMQRQRELSALKSRYASIEARRRANQDRLRDHNSSYGSVMGGDPGLQSRSGLSAYYSPYADSEATELPAPPDYCFTAIDPAAKKAPDGEAK